MKLRNHMALLNLELSFKPTNVSEKLCAAPWLQGFKQSMSVSDLLLDVGDFLL